MAKLIRSIMLFSILFLFLGGLSVTGEETANIKDDMQYLSVGEITGLQEVIDGIKSSESQEVVIVITDQMEGKTSMAYADDYFDYNGYGVGEDQSGILMLINMSDREVWLSTKGHSIDVFTDARIEKMVDNVTSYLSDGNFYIACDVFLGDVSYYSEQGVVDGQYREDENGEKTYYEEKSSFLFRVLANLFNPFIYLIAIVITIIAIVIITLSSKGKVTVTSRTYENANSFKLSNRVDQYISQHTTRRKIEKDTSSSSGGSSTHSSSSGSSHGGGGGSF